MKVTAAAARTCEQVGAPRFTGTVWNEALATGAGPDRLHVARVTFAPGARTAWHAHPLGQVLLVEQGLGLVQRDGRPVEVIRSGDTVVIRPGERHWHGATPDQLLMHVAMQGATAADTQADWHEPVGDQDYQRAAGTATGG